MCWYNAPKSTIHNYINEVPCFGFWFGDNWFSLATSHPFSFCQGICLHYFFGVGIDGLGLECCQQILYSCIGMFSFLMVWALSPFYNFISSIFFWVRNDGFGLSLLWLVQKYLHIMSIDVNILQSILLISVCFEWGPLENNRNCLARSVWLVSKNVKKGHLLFWHFLIQAKLNELLRFIHYSWCTHYAWNIYKDRTDKVTYCDLCLLRTNGPKIGLLGTSHRISCP